MDEKRFRSIVKRMVLFPFLVMMIVVVVAVVSYLLSFYDMQEQQIVNNLNALQVTMNQLDSTLAQVDYAFLDYCKNNIDYQYMKNYDKETPKEEYFMNEASTGKWLSDQISVHRDVQGAFAYYRDMDLLIFRESNNRRKYTDIMIMRQYIRDQLVNGRENYNYWEIITVEEIQYLINFKKYGNFYGGVWMPISELEENLYLEEENYMGTVYLMDLWNNNSIEDDSLNGVLVGEGLEKKTIRCGKESYYNYHVSGVESEGIYLGMMIPKKYVIMKMPTINKILFLLVLLSVVLVPVIILWMKQKIAGPVKAIDRAMSRIGEGDMEYRIPLTDKRYFDEFDRLIVRFNKMMDDLNEMEFTLYKTKIKEQRTELKYISQQIRPHFILNALNIIYTYEENEFPLVKEMVLYLTEYFRYIVNLRVDFVEVEKELRHVENYLKIQKERYINKLDYFIEWEASVGMAPIPPLIIQTFVENCIKYGMRVEGKTFIFVLASMAEDRLKLMIADTGSGFSQDKLRQIRQFIEKREFQDELGVGIQNAIERMDILYGETVEINVYNALSGGAVVEIFLPIS